MRRKYGMSVAVGKKGQVTIEKRIRQALGIGPGWRASQSIEDGRLVMRFHPPRHRRSLAGILRDATTVRVETEEEFRELAEAAWAAEAGLS